jgi:peptidoglycan hydrolase-like protein with peptidoglycan-binding domain
METPAWFEPFKKAIEKLIEAIFGPKPEESVASPEPAPSTTVISKVPIFGDTGEHVRQLQLALNKSGSNLRVDGSFGPITRAAVSDFQKTNGMAGSGVIGAKTLELLGLKIDEKPPISGANSSKIPWFWALKKHEGKKETDTAFQSYMNKFWRITGLPNFTGLVGSARAWCGIFAAAGLVYAGYQLPVNSFRAKAWDNYCQAIDWKKNGFPQGAYVRINSSANCTSASGNHITLANGDCTAQDLTKAGATFSGYGGNQGSMAKVSRYPARNICAVRWPCEVPLPAPVLKSNNCSSQGATGESTR